MQYRSLFVGAALAALVGVASPITAQAWDWDDDDGDGRAYNQTYDNGDDYYVRDEYRRYEAPRTYYREDYYPRRRWADRGGLVISIPVPRIEFGHHSGWHHGGYRRGCD